MATTSTTTPAPTSTTEQPVWIKVTPKAGRPGSTVEVDTRCCAPTFTTTGLDIASHGITLSGGTDEAVEVLRFDATVKDVPAGRYKVTVTCLDGPNMTKSGAATATFTVLPKAQVPVKPVGAPQTGGGYTADVRR